MKYSRTEYNKLGDRIRLKVNDLSKDDLDMLQDLRVSYKDDLATIYNTITDLTRKIDKCSISTYRVKRIESIISKLQRTPQMELGRMADIAGCRCIMESNEKVYLLYNQINEVLHIKKVNDYIKYPKAEGYRSLHLIVTINKQTNNQIEIQIRCKADHNWATLVETTDLLFNTKIKETGENGELVEFHRLLSLEEELDINAKKRLIKIADNHNYFDILSSVYHKNYMTVRGKWNNVRGSKRSYYLISTDNEGNADIFSYSKFIEAEKAYFEKYKNNENNENIVLTCLQNATFEDISLAYSNYFLTYNALFLKCYAIVADLVKYAYTKNRIFYFAYIYKFFLNLTLHIIGVHLKDIIEYENKKITIKSNFKRRDWELFLKAKLKDVSKKFNSLNDKMPYSYGRRIIVSEIKKRKTKSFLKHLNKQSLS